MTGAGAAGRAGSRRSTSRSRSGARACAGRTGRRPRSSSSTTTASRCRPGRMGGASCSSGRARSTGGPTRSGVPVPRGAVRAVLQIEKIDGLGTIRIDDVRVTAAPNPEAGAWTPVPRRRRHDGLAPGRRLRRRSRRESRSTPRSCSTAPAGKHGFVTVKDGRLAFTQGRPGPVLRRQPAAADRVPRARAGRRAGRPPGPIGHQPRPARRPRHALGPTAACSTTPATTPRRSTRRPGPARPPDRRPEGAGDLRRARAPERPAVPRRRRRRRRPDCSRPAAARRPSSTRRSASSRWTTARALLDHVNPETGLALRDDPVLAWVTLAGEVSLFDLIDDPDAAAGRLRQGAPRPGREEHRRLPAGGSGSALETAHCDGSWPTRSRKDKLQRADRRGLALAARARVRPRRRPRRARPDRRPALLDHPRLGRPRIAVDALEPDGGLAGSPATKREADRPYVVGQWCNQTSGAWALPFEAADVLLAVAYRRGRGLGRPGPPRGLRLPRDLGRRTAGHRRRRGHLPDPRGRQRHPPGLRPLAARRLAHAPPAAGSTAASTAGRAAAGGARRGRVDLPAGTPRSGRLVIDTPYTQGLAGWVGGEPAILDHLEIVDREPLRRRWSPPRSAPSRSPRPSGCWSRRWRGSSRPASAGSTTGGTTWPTRAGRRSSRSRSRPGSSGGARGPPRLRPEQRRRSASGRPRSKRCRTGGRCPGHRRPDRRLPLGVGRRVITHRVRTGACRSVIGARTASRGRMSRNEEM